jgi:rubredoxin
MEGSEEYKCDICGMVFVNDTELARHQKFVHENKMFQCQACNKFFDKKQEFEKHVEFHIKHHPSNFINTDKNKREENTEEIESILLKQSVKQKKARKRTRGPYRKSSS